MTYTHTPMTETEQRHLHSKHAQTVEQRRRLIAMNADIERFYREGRDTEAINLEARTNALARRCMRDFTA